MERDRAGGAGRGGGGGKQQLCVLSGWGRVSGRPAESLSHEMLRSQPPRAPAHLHGDLWVHLQCKTIVWGGVGVNLKFSGLLTIGLTLGGCRGKRGGEGPG